MVEPEVVLPANPDILPTSLWSPASLRSTLYFRYREKVQFNISTLDGHVHCLPPEFLIGKSESSSAIQPPSSFGLTVLIIIVRYHLFLSKPSHVPMSAFVGSTPCAKAAPSKQKSSWPMTK